MGTTYGGQVINGALVQVCLTVGPVGLGTHLVVISLQNLHTGSLTCEVRAIMVGKAK